MAKMKAIDWIAVVFVIIGAINWGLVGLFDFNLVSWIFSGWLETLMYSLVGASGVYSIYSLWKANY